MNSLFYVTMNELCALMIPYCYRSVISEMGCCEVSCFFLFVLQSQPFLGYKDEATAVTEINSEL